MKKKGIIICSSLLVTFLFSCENKNNEVPTTDQNQIEFVYGPTIKIKDDFTRKNQSRKQEIINGEWKTLNKENLKELSESVNINYNNVNDAKEQFTKVFNRGTKQPKGVFINERNLGEGTNPNTKEEWHAEFRAKGEPINDFNNENTNFTPFKRIRGTASRSEVNNSGERKFMELSGEWRIETSNESNWNVTGNISTKVGGSIGVPLVTKGSIEVAVGLSAGGGGSHSKKITEVIRGGNGIWVPAGHVANWELEERHKNFKTKWRVPLEFKGKVGADFGERYHGSYFWSVPAIDFFADFLTKAYLIDLNEEYSKEIRVRTWVSKK